MRCVDRNVWALGSVLACVVAAGVALGADWPTYRHDAARSGVTSDALKPPLAAAWTYQPLHAPRPAWGDPNPRPVGGWFGYNEGRRMHFDDAYHAVVAGGLAFFGSSADGKVTALDAATGQVRWAALTGGPVRLAPTVWQGKVYVGSDDGWVYCYRASDGEVVWTFRAAPSDRKVLGSGQMVSLWPLRTSVLVEGGVAYVGAGIFPAEGVYIYALDAATGKELWCNDTSAAAPMSRISPQGYLLASPDKLFVPMGRTSPAGYDRKDGRLVRETYFEHQIGGTYALLAEGQMVTGTTQLIAYDPNSNARFAWFKGRQIIVTPAVAYLADGRELKAIDRKTYPKASLRRKALNDRWNRARGGGVRAARTVRQREQAVQQSTKALEALEAKAAAAKEIEAARRTLAADRKALEAAQGNKAYKQWQALLADIQKADAAIADTITWRCPTAAAEMLILAGDVLVAGGDGEVVAVDTASGRKLWSAKVSGLVRGLSVADGRLYASTNTGAIHCFGPAGTRSLGTIREQASPTPFARDALTPVIEAAAQHIVGSTGVKKGYALVLGSGSGRLVYELARRTELVVYGVEADAQKVAASRKALDAAGLYGTRVRIDQLDPARVPYAEFFANLVVSETALTDGTVPGSAAEAHRMLKPLGGTLCIGQPAAKGTAKALTATALRQWASNSPLKDAKVTEQAGAWLAFTRGPLPGAGSWTHQYAEPGNTTCSDDTRVKCPLGVLWFGDPGPTEMAERHRRPAAPLATNGRLFIQGEGAANRIGAGENAIMCYDAYNGVKLWERRIRGALRVVLSHNGSNAAVNADSFFIAAGDTCVRLDAATGETKQTYRVPPAKDGKRGNWGYVAVVDGRLYGSRTEGGRAADAVFCLDLATGKLRWQHEAAGIPQSSIAIGGDTLFLATRAVSPAQRQQALQEQTAAAEKLAGAERKAAMAKIKNAAVRLVVALDAKTGAPLWQQPMELTGATGGAYWCSLGAAYSQDVLLLFGVYADGHYWKQFFAGQFETRRVAALSARDGRMLWQRHIGYRVRPIVIADTLHAEPWAFNIRTGQQKTRVHPITGQEEMWQFARPGHHCGCPAAAPNIMLFRSHTLGWYDLVGDYGTQHFGGTRTSCWINFIPANGLLMVPEGGSGCLCPFPNACTVVFTNRTDSRAWAYYSSPGPLTPVKHLALNLGAPGDRRAPDGALWLGYPRPGGSLVLKFRVEVALYPGGGYFRHDPARLQIGGTDAPWVFRSGARGLRQCVVPLVGDGEGDAVYTVRLAFAELDDGAKPGTRVFDVKLQGKLVAKGVDVAKEAGGIRKALVREFKGVAAKDKLTIELVAPANPPAAEQTPVLQGVEIVREKVLGLGVRLPAFELHDAAREQSGVVRLGNFTGGDFAGTLRLAAPDGFAVTPSEAPVALPSGKRLEIALKAALTRKGKRAKYPIAAKLVRADGGVAWEGTTQIDYLGSIGRATLKAVEDTWVVKSAPDANRGDVPRLDVDGGNPTFGDQGHAIAYLKFKLALPGPLLKAVLRLHNAGNPTADSGQIRLLAAPWSEKTITYNNRPKPGKVLAKIGKVGEHQVVELPLPLTAADLAGKAELSLVIDPTSTDGVTYVSREGKKPAELVIEYQAPEASNK